MLSCLVCGLVGFVVVSSIILSGSVPNSFADSNPASVNVTSSCTLTATGNTVHSATVIPGNYTEIVSNPINVSCNDSSGYALYAIGYSGDSLTAANHTKLIAGSISSDYDIATNTSGDNSYWAMKVAVSGTNAPTIDNSYNSYQQIPANYVKISHYSNSSLGENNSVTTPTYKVSISAAQPVDIYTGKVKYAMVHPSTMVPGAYTINFFANGGTGSMVSVMPENYEDYTLPASTLIAPAGYSFAGWCTVQDQTASGVVNGADPQTTCTGATYTDVETIPNSAIVSGGILNLYAMWGSLYMQDQTTSSLNSLMPNVDDSFTLYDKRDGQAYLIAKLADGNYWMLDNLSLGSVQLNESLSSSNTNMPANSSFTLPASTSPWDTDASAAYTTAMINTSYANTTVTTYGEGSGKVGVYYNFCAASAGTYCYNSSSGTGHALYDICPAGWRMPAEYLTFYQAYGENTSDALVAISLTASGEIRQGAVSKQGSAISVWMSPYSSASEMRRYYFESGVENIVDDHGSRSLGGVVRCTYDNNQFSSYVVTFNPNANDAQLDTWSKPVMYGVQYGSLPTPTRPGYTFVGWMTDPSSNFDYIYYADTYQDLYDTFGYDETALWDHYVRWGKNENRKTNANQRSQFDYYIDSNDTTLYAAWR